MAYDQLTRAWRIGYGIAGFVLVLVGVPGTVAEIYLATHGYPLAWAAAVLTIVLTAVGSYLLYAVWQGRIHTLGIGRARP